MGNGYFNSDQNAEARFTEIAYLLQAGKKIDAIKVYRQVTGVSLAEAKAAIENMEATGMLGMITPQVGTAQSASPAMLGVQEEMLAEIARLIAQNKKIQAIKLYRSRTGADLATAKNAVERIEVRMRTQGF